MGQGGTLVLINGTPYQWKKTSCKAAQMRAWELEFPETIEAGKISKVNIKWSEYRVADPTKNSGNATYKLCGTATPHSFEVQARNTDGFKLQVDLQSIDAMGNPEGSVIGLGWKRNGFVYFILSGTEGSFSSTKPPIAWMQRNLRTLGSRSLRHLCIPGSRNSGMSRSSSSAVMDHWLISQRVPIITQLNLGVRYLDCRPVCIVSADSSEFFAGYYSDFAGFGWQGGNGQSFEEIISEVNTFTEDNKELIILNLSHDLTFEVGRQSRSFCQAEWDQLFKQLTGDRGLNNLFVAPNPMEVDLTALSLNQFIGTNQAAVVVIVQPGDFGISLDQYYHQRGIYERRQLNAIHRSSKTHRLDSMVQDQLNFMRNNRNSLLMLSWRNAHTTNTLMGLSVLKLSEKALPRIYTDLLPGCSKDTYPNILFLDGVDSSDITALAMAINDISRGVVAMSATDHSLPQIFLEEPQDFIRKRRGSVTNSMFGESTNVMINGGHFIQSTQQGTNEGIKELSKASSVNAMHSSVERRNAPRCDPERHTSLLKKIIRWGQENSEPPIMWLLGPELAGKSKIAQALAETWEDGKILLASFFFYQHDTSRNHALPLFTTIAYQVTKNFSASWEVISRVPERDPLVLKKCLEAQLTSLIIEPLQQVYQDIGGCDAATPYLIIIDGLDQCRDPEIQIDILNSIAKAINECEFPLKFFITSRPEPHIVAGLESDAIKPILSSHSLVDDPGDPHITAELDSETIIPNLGGLPG